MCKILHTEHLSLTDVFSGFLAKLFLKGFAYAMGMARNEISFINVINMGDFCAI